MGVGLSIVFISSIIYFSFLFVSFFTSILKVWGVQLCKMSSEIKIKITSWNCRGLRKLKKTKQVMNRIK